MKIPEKLPTWRHLEVYLLLAKCYARTVIAEYIKKYIPGQIKVSLLYKDFHKASTLSTLRQKNLFL